MKKAFCFTTLIFFSISLFAYAAGPRINVDGSALNGDGSDAGPSIDIDGSALNGDGTDAGPNIDPFGKQGSSITAGLSVGTMLSGGLF